MCDMVHRYVLEEERRKTCRLGEQPCLPDLSGLGVLLLTHTARVDLDQIEHVGSVTGFIVVARFVACLVMSLLLNADSDKAHGSRLTSQLAIEASW